MYNCNVTYLKFDILEYLQWNPEPFDVIYSTSVLEHIKIGKIIPILTKLYSHLVPGGLFLHIVDDGVKHEELLEKVGEFYGMKKVQYPKRVAFY
jgi:2-polyprenyl-3-methyl-5-hydroxy-6-metoxy-1,4-benzoquinol methylase